MVVAVFLGLQHVHEQSRKIQCIGRCTDLIIYHAYGIVGLSDVQHGLDEVLSVEAEDPGDADDEILLEGPRDGLLTAELRLTIVVERRIILTVRLPRGLALTVEDVVGGDIDHLRIHELRGIGDVLHAVNIDRLYLRTVRLILCGVNRGPGRTVHDHIRMKLANDGGNLGTIRDIHLHIRHTGHRRIIHHTAVHRLDVRADTLVAAFREFVHHIVTELTIDTCYKYVHKKPLSYAIHRLQAALTDRIPRHDGAMASSCFSFSL